MNKPILVSLLMMLLLAVGCASTPVLTFDSVDASRRFVQKFPHAHYTTAQGSGAYDVVLFGQTLDVSGSRGGLIQTINGDDLQQIVHLHVLWRPTRGQKPNELAAGNAVINWYVIDPKSDQPPLHYRGTGFVLVRPGEKTTRFSIRGATIVPQSGKTALVDPLGRSTLTGSFTARRDEASTRNILMLVSPPVTVPSAKAEAPLHAPPARTASRP